MVTFEEWYKDNSGLYPLALPKKQLYDAYTAGQESLRPLVEKMMLALQFYADPLRYQGANQRPLEGDRYVRDDCPYRIDVTRDCGDIAKQAMAEADKFLGKGE